MHLKNRRSVRFYFEICGMNSKSSTRSMHRARTGLQTLLPSIMPFQLHVSLDVSTPTMATVLHPTRFASLLLNKTLSKMSARHNIFLVMLTCRNIHLISSTIENFAAKNIGKVKGIMIKSLIFS